jgi:sugar transferase (PEP-CTERM/EpsH1 system associated)
MVVDERPVVLHVVYRFDVGGLENGIVNLINHMPENAYRHVVLALTDITGFKARVERRDVEFIAMNKPPGHGLWLYPALYRAIRRIRPAVVHTRNLAALEVAVPAWLAKVPVRVHGEHGRDVHDLAGHSRKYQWLRRAYRPFVHHYVALSRDLADYLREKIGVPPSRIAQIYNGVDTGRFAPAVGGPAPILGCPFAGSDLWLVGTVGRMQEVKDQVTLARAFVLALEVKPALRDRLRLVMVGDGPLRARAQAVLDEAGCAALAWLPGERQDVPDVMRGFSCFVLPSLAEGISNTILEAMATGLPVLATDVGGNADLVAHGRCGEIVPSGDDQALAACLVRWASAPAQSSALGQAARAEVERRFSLSAMVAAYQELYDRLLASVGANPRTN